MPLATVYPLVSTRSLARPFTYEVPEGVAKGAVVSVRLGRSTTRGVVADVGVEAPPGIVLSAVGRLLDVTNRIRSLPEVVSTETFLYLELWKQLYDWGVGDRGEANAAAHGDHEAAEGST